ncbi:transcriptional regulator [Pasteurellaceae bacterium 15-036681]|nr:transcriptional regulator [Pasteurellaceae bacterium 15-036681]
MSINERLRLVIEYQKMSIKAFAEEMDIPLRTLHNYLSGERDPNTPFLSKIALRLNINLNWLLIEKGELNILSTDERTLSSEELELLNHFNSCSNDIKRKVMVAINAIASDEKS